jgi:phytanoyl-CoA hydroxylase
MLSLHQQQAFQEQGYLILPGFKTAAEIAALRARAEALVEAFDPGAQRAVFSTQEQDRKVDDYFLDSAEQMRCFFEEEAFDAQGRLRQPKALSINKIGHAMHELDPVFRAFSTGPALAGVARAVGLARPQVWQSMYIFKQPGIGGEVRWHQDASFFETEPVTVTTFWFALEDATRDNGCLWAEPGGHRSPLRERFVREGRRAWMETLDAQPWPSTEALAVPLEVEAGALVLFHGLLPHYSAANRSARSRHAYTLHVTDASSRYAARNWLQRSAALPVRGFERD